MKEQLEQISRLLHFCIKNNFTYDLAVSRRGWQLWSASFPPNNDGYYCFRSRYMILNIDNQTLDLIYEDEYYKEFTRRLDLKVHIEHILKSAQSYAESQLVSKLKHEEQMRRMPIFINKAKCQIEQVINGS